MTILERILFLIKESDLNQKTFCENTGILEKTFSTWKSRNTNPPADLLPSIADFLHVSIDALVRGSSTENVIPTSDDAQDILKNYALLDNRGKHRVHTVIYEELDRIAARGNQTFSPSKQTAEQSHTNKKEINSLSSQGKTG